MKPFFYFILAILLLALSGAIIGVIFGIVSLGTTAHFFIPGHNLVGGLVGLSALLTMIIPLSALFYFLTRFIHPYDLPYNVRRGVRYTWLVAFFIMLYGAIDTFRSFKSSDTFTSTESFDVSADNISIHFMDPSNYSGGTAHIGDLELSASRLFSDDIYVRIEKAGGNQVTIEERINSYGSNAHDAMIHAQGISEHQVEVAADGTINIPASFSVPKGKKYRGQAVEYTIAIPEGKKVTFDDRAQQYVVSSYFDTEVERPYTLKKYAWTMSENGLIAKDWINENKYRKDIDIADVNTLQIKGNFEIDIVNSDDYTAALVGRQEIVDKIVYVRQDDIFSIVDEDGIIEYPVKLFVRLPELQNLTTSSDENIRVEGFDQDKMEILLTGEGDINAYIDIGELKVTAENRNKINLTGEGNTLYLDVDGNATVNAENYPVRVMFLKNKIARLRARVAEEIRALKGTSKRMRIYGDPEILIGQQYFSDTTKEKKENTDASE